MDVAGGNVRGSGVALFSIMPMMSSVDKRPGSVDPSTFTKHIKNTDMP